MQMLQFKDQPVRIVMKGEDPWWVAKDVCDVLEIRNQRDAVGSLDDDEKGVATTDTLGGSQALNIVNEPGLYSLIFRSRKPQARDFKRWVTHEVLPQIRKTGGYGKVAPSVDDLQPHAKSFFASLDGLRERGFSKAEALKLAMKLHAPEPPRKTPPPSMPTAKLAMYGKLNEVGIVEHLRAQGPKWWRRSDLEREVMTIGQVSESTASRFTQKHATLGTFAQAAFTGAYCLAEFKDQLTQQIG